MRLDQYIAKNFELSRNRAQFLIDEKLVKINEIIITKASFQVEENDKVEIIEDKRIEYVARSAIKLEEFLKEIEIDISGKICLDVGASTGGFTQVLLNRGASQVVAVDVGTSQLHEKIKNDSRVISLENTDIRKLKIEKGKLSLSSNIEGQDDNKNENRHSEINSESKNKKSDYSQLLEMNESGFDIIVVDVSFISLHKIIESLKNLSSLQTKIILLFKPQFEVGRINLRKTGVPKDDKVVIEALDKFKKLCKEKGFKITKISESKLLGEAGNKEYLIFMGLN